MLLKPAKWSGLVGKPITGGCVLTKPIKKKLSQLDIALDFAESELFKQIKEGNITGVIFFLKTKGKKRGYIERSEFDHTTKGEKINVSINIAGDDLSSDDIE